LFTVCFHTFWMLFTDSKGGDSMSFVEPLWLACFVRGISVSSSSVWSLLLFIGLKTFRNRLAEFHLTHDLLIVMRHKSSYAITAVSHWNRQAALHSVIADNGFAAPFVSIGTFLELEALPRKARAVAPCVGVRTWGTSSPSFSVGVLSLCTDLTDTIEVHDPTGIVPVNH
jgi:hypothetical protein